MVAVVVWRARRLGALATEPLPVVVRAVETTRSLGRLYRRAGDRGHAAAVAAAVGAGDVRRAAAARLARRPGRPWCARSPAAPAGPRPRSPDCSTRPRATRDRPPTEDLITLAQDLAELDREVREHMSDADDRPPSHPGARERLAAVRAEVGKAVVGQDAAVSGLLVALLCGGHVLMEGVPGTAKTLLVRTLAGALDGRAPGGCSSRPT